MPRTTRRSTRRPTYRRKKRMIKRKFGRKKGSTTSISYRSSKRLRQIIPDRYFVWMDLYNMGYIASGTSTGSYVILLNDLSAPFNTGSVLPNLQTAAATAQPVGYKNLLYNSGTSTGLWSFFRVWSVQVIFTITPQSAGDAVNYGFAPVLAGDAYTSIVNIGQGSNSTIITANANSSPRACTYRKHFSIPALQGIPKKDYAVFTSNQFGSFTTPPGESVNLQIRWETMDEANTTAAVGYSVRLRYHVEFFSRADTALLDV